MDIIDFKSIFNIIYPGIVPFKQHSLFDVNRSRISTMQHGVGDGVGLE